MKKFAVTFAVVALALLARTAEAQTTIGYWRFESDPLIFPGPVTPPNDPEDYFGVDWLNDESGNGLTLTNPKNTNTTFTGRAGDAGQTPVGTSNPNSVAPAFPSIIPQTGESNDWAAFTLNADNFLSHPADPLFPILLEDFTLEAYVQFSADEINNNKNADIVTQWGGGTDNVFRFMKNTNNQLQMGLAGNGTAFYNSSTFTFDALDVYYVAALVDLETDASTVDFYVQNLTDGTPMQFINGFTAAANIPGPLHQNSTAEFRIGGHNLSSTAPLAGADNALRIDEVRLTDGLLSQSQLLQTSAFDPADLNFDGFVDGLDLGILLGNWGTTTTPDQGELDGTPPVDGLDLGILLGSWNPPPAAATAVPEPTSIVLVMFGLTGSLAAIRRR